MQSDNSVSITGKVVRGPFVSFINDDKTKMRVKYQVQVESRKKDNGQSFTPWVRSLGNQAQKDYDNIKIGDVITVGGRIVTRNENKKRYFRLVKNPETGNDELTEIDSEDPNVDNYDDIMILVDRRMVTEVQADDVRYFSKTLAMLSEAELSKHLGQAGIDKIRDAKVTQQKIDNEVAEKKGKADEYTKKLRENPSLANEDD